MWFQCVCPLMPSCNTYPLTWVSLNLGHGVSLHGCSSKAQLLFLTLDKGYLLTATVPDLQRGIAPLGPPVPAEPSLLGLLLPAAGPDLGRGWLLPAAAPGLRLRVAPQGHCHWPRARSGFSWPLLISDTGCLLQAATGLRCRIAPPGRCPDLRCGVAVTCLGWS